MNGPVLSLRDVTKTIDTGTHRVEILRGISFDVHKGEYVAVMGASGSGKSTLLGLVAGLDTPTSGSIRIEGEEISRLDEDRLAVLRGRKIGFVFQSYQLIPTLTAEENVLLPAELAGEDLAPAQQRARELLKTVGLEQRLDHYPVQLSGGEQQRVALARAFVRKPPLLLADEPTGNLDSVNGRQVLELMLSMNRSEGATLLLVTHDRELAAHASRIITLRDGRILSDERRAAA
jgi:putative ABC transport system ATP-binding protein